MTTSREYNSNVINKNGYIILLPNVGYAEDLLQNTTVNPYAESQYQEFPVGTRAIRGEQEFVYTKNGAAALSTLGTPLQAAAIAHAEQSDDIVVGAAAAIGATEVHLTSTANLDTSPNDSENDFAEGYLIVNDEAGEGQMYKIKANEAFSTTDDTLITLYDPLTVALTTSSQVGIARNPFYKVIATTAPLTGIFVGVNLIAVTANYYFWAQVKGPAPANANEAVTIGQQVVVGLTAAKVDAFDVTSTVAMIIGTAFTVGVTGTEKFMVNLN